METMMISTELAGVTRCPFGVSRHCLGMGCMAWVYQTPEEGDPTKGHCARVIDLISKESEEGAA